MPAFSEHSLQQLKTVHPSLRAVLEDAIQYIDFRVECGHRGEAEQDQAFHEGNSKVMWPHSRHNSNPSQAVDITPYYAKAPHTRWNDRESFWLLAGYIKSCADRLGIAIRWGGNWRSDNDYEKAKWEDLPHFELTNPVKEE